MSSNFTNSKRNKIMENIYYRGYYTARNRNSRKSRKISLAPQLPCWVSPDCEDRWFYLKLRGKSGQTKPDPSTVKGPEKKKKLQFGIGNEIDLGGDENDANHSVNRGRHDGKG